MRVYIAGPMSGIEDFNFPAFNAAARSWNNCGFDVLNPAGKYDGRVDLPYRIYIDSSMVDLIACDVVAVLPGWENSRGAQLEVMYARTVGKRVVDATHPSTRPERWVDIAG